MVKTPPFRRCRLGLFWRFFNPSQEVFGPLGIVKSKAKKSPEALHKPGSFLGHLASTKTSSASFSPRQTGRVFVKTCKVAIDLL